METSSSQQTQENKVYDLGPDEYNNKTHNNSQIIPAHGKQCQHQEVSNKLLHQSKPIIAVPTEEKPSIKLPEEKKNDVAEETKAQPIQKSQNKKAEGKSDEEIKAVKQLNKRIRTL